MLFEAFAIRLLTAARSVEEAHTILGLNWHQVEAIKAPAVQRGLAHRKETNIRYLGVDEKQFRSGHRYISNLYDLEGGQVLEVVEERTEQACNTDRASLNAHKQQSEVSGIALECGRPMPTQSLKYCLRP